MADNSLHTSPAIFYREVVLSHSGDECLLWPFGVSKAGYPMLWLDGQMRPLHRLEWLE